MILSLGVTVTVGWDWRDVYGGDLPAFYRAGSLINDGSAGDLYDDDALEETQGPPIDDEWPLPYLYPPFVASAYSGLARLPYRSAFLLHAAMMIGLTGAAVAMLRLSLPRVSRWGFEAFALAVSFYPLSFSLVNGQNTAFSLVVLAAGYVALDSGLSLLAGALLGLLFFKPQLAIPIVGLLVIRHQRALIGMSISAVALWIWGAAVSGPDWIELWLRAALRKEAELVEIVPIWNINVADFTQEIFGRGSVLSYIIAGVILVNVIGALTFVWWHRSIPMDLKFAALTCGILLIPPHILWAQAGLLVLPFAILANRLGRAALGPLVGLTALCTVAFAATPIAAIPIFSTVALTAAWIGIEVKRSLSHESRKGIPAGIPMR